MDRSAPRRAPAPLVRGLTAAALFALAGCESREPRASISDPAVFTALHLRAAQNSLEAQGTQRGTTIADMERYLRTPQSDYDAKRLRMDAMLDSNQRSRAIAQAVLSSVAVELELLAKSAELGDVLDDGDDSDEKPESKPDAEADEDKESEKADAAAELAKAIEALSAKVDELAKLATTDISDSPFDAVDRAQDFYTTVLHKSLRNFGVDSHVVPPEETFAVLEASERLNAARVTLANAQANLDAALLRQKANVPSDRIGAKAELQAAFKQTTGSELPKTPDAPERGAKTPAPALTTGTTPLKVAAAQDPTPAPVPGNGGSSLSGTALNLEPPSRPTGPTPVEINESARKAEEARKAAAEAEEKASKAKKDAADAEAKAAIEQAKKNELELKLKESALKSDAQDHAQQLEWYQKLSVASSKVDEEPGDSQEVDAAREAVEAAAERVRLETEAFNRTVADARGALNDGVPASFGSTETMTGAQRLVVLLIQAHVDRGLEPNHMVGIRAKVTGAHAKETPIDAGQIRVVRLHPTRNYDREDALFAEQLSEQMLLSVAGKFSSSVNGSAARQLAAESAEKQRFLARIPKVSSWADAARHEFGWDFYPNNLGVRRRGPIARSAGLVYGPAARQFEVLAHLDPGARDCAVYAIVPCNVTSITIELETITADISSPWDSARTVVDQSGTVTIPLPPFHPAEWKAGLGVPAAIISGGAVISPAAAPR